ncbi:MFS transporter [Fulvivirga sedimenti]|uniref:MFS transporter n=1 Tax=Fulvivirga sedimenti TaxID=2879465 RepID=A0A9X1HVT1_9BACT|nr:MFS transporter [Fulvivirga sedimenti]MCA6079168.1 MFS transporter [Fulvivirga sedimenti]
MLRKLLRYIRSAKYRSVGLTFLLMSILFAFWVTRLPDVRDKLGLSEGQIGLALFFIPSGALAAMLMSHSVNRRFGEGRIMTISLLLLSVTSIFPLLATTYISLCVSLFFFGFTMGFTDISMNSVVSIFEKRDKVKIMSTTHGFFSLGGIIGASLGSLIAGVGIGMATQMVATAAVVILIDLLVIRPVIKNERDDHNNENEALFAIPKGPLLPLAIIGFCIMMAEGSIADWSAIFLDDVVHAPAHLLGFGYAAFSFTMTIGRFYGDELSSILGQQKVLILGCLIALGGFFLTLTGGLIATLGGFALIGVGFSSVVPVLFSISGSMPGVSSSYGIASVGSAGYAGFLLGPVAIGIVAEFQDLTRSFMLLMFLTFLALILARFSFPSVK